MQSNTVFCYYYAFKDSPREDSLLLSHAIVVFFVFFFKKSVVICASMQVNIHHVYLVPPGGERGGLALKALSVGEFKKKLLTFRGGGFGG